ncbi:MAG: class I SAM-dependent methyltransferase [Patescibacteria group bacterium]
MFSDPVKNLKLFGLREDSIVADLGAGTGFYSVAAGGMVPKGKVYAIEIVKDFLTTIKNKVKDAHLDNVDIIWGNVEDKHGTHLADSIVDAVIASNIFFQVEDKNQFIEEIKRILKPSGKILIIDWLPEDSKDALPIKFKGSMSKERAREMFEKKGLLFDRDIDAGVHHYGMILKKQ